MSLTSGMLDAALEYTGRQYPVFPVWGVTGGRCGCGKYPCGDDNRNAGKHPLGSVVANGVKGATRDPATIRQWWHRYPTANIATPTSWCAVLDVDPRHGGDDALAALEREHCPLPETAEVLTGGGGRHVYFTPVPGLAPSNGKVGPGLDIKSGDGAYVLLPPSSHVSGGIYRDEILHPLFETPLAPMPAWLVARATAATTINGGGQQHRPPDEWAAKLIGAPEGKRRAVALEIAGHYLGLRIALGEVEEILLGYAARCTPQFPEREVRALVRDLARRDRAKRPPAAAAGDDRGPVPAAAPVLSVPAAGMVGLAADFAKLHASYLEAPRSFFFFAYLTYFGHLVAQKITLDSELRPEPRLYTVAIGESADTRKSTALRKTDDFFRSLGTPWEPRVLYGVGSAEGIAAELKETSTLLLHFDELKSFVDKAKAEHSVALPMVATLFERGEYDNRTKSERLSVRGAALSLLAACTVDTYATMFDQRFFAIGLLNRLFIVVDHSTTKIPIPRPIPDAALNLLRERTRQQLEAVDAAYVAHGVRPVAYTLTPGALQRFQAWYNAREGSIFERRLDTYAHRLMVLLAATTGRNVIDEALVDAVLALVRYQLDARRECDPVDAENLIAGLEEKIRRALARGALKGRELKRRCSYHRVGIWAWKTALANLIAAGEVHRDPKQDLFWLGENVSTFVSTPRATESPNGDAH